MGAIDSAGAKVTLTDHGLKVEAASSSTKWDRSLSSKPKGRVKENCKNGFDNTMIIEKSTACMFLSAEKPAGFLNLRMLDTRNSP